MVVDARLDEALEHSYSELGVHFVSLFSGPYGKIQKRPPT